MTDEARVGSPPRWTLRRTIATAATVAALAVLVWFNRSDFDTLRGLSLGLTASLVGVQVIYLPAQSYRYRIVTEAHAGDGIDSVLWFRIFCISTLLNNFVMQAGLVYQSTALRREAGVRLSAYVGSYASAGWLSLLLNIGLSVSLLLTLSPEVDLGPAPAWLTMAVLGIGVGTAPVVLRRFARMLGSSNRLVRVSNEILDTTLGLPGRPGFLQRFLLASIATSVLGAVTIMLGASALGASVRPGEAMLFLALVQMASMVSITPGNIGIRELAFGIAGGALETGAANGLLISTLTRATGIAALLIGAAGASTVEYLRPRVDVEPGEC